MTTLDQLPADDSVLIERKDNGIVLLTLNAPERRNAIGLEIVQRLHAILDALQVEQAAGKTVSVLVLTGAGDKAFAAGADIAQLRERRSPEALQAINSTLFKRIEDFPVPSIAAIKGYALGGGCELAIACDLRVAGESAKLGQPEVKLGIVPGAGGTYRLPRLIGLGRARELIYTGRMVGAVEAERIGLVNRVVADAKVVDAALELAGEIAKNGSLAVRLAKSAMNALARPGEAAAMSFESAAQAVLFDSDDKFRRMDAFLDQRKSK